MTILTQQRILRTVGICLVTMLVLTVAQVIIRISGLFDARQFVILLFLFPLFAILSGAASRLMTGNPWITILVSVMAYTIVIVVLVDSSALVYFPIYILLSLFGYATMHWYHQKRKTHV